MKNRLRSDNGFMGPTHALSSVAIFALLTWIANDFIFDNLLKTRNPSVFIAALIIVIGASLMPDLDATNSTTISVLGIIGKGLSAMMRASSKAIQLSVRGKYDKTQVDPHRGFWHTAVAAALAGLFFGLLTSISYPLPVEIVGRTVTIGMLVVILLLFISLQLMLASLFSSYYKKVKGAMGGKLVVSLVSAAIAGMMVFALPSDISYAWVGTSITLGWLIHILGDMFTVAGVPVFFPITKKGKKWWTYRMPLRVKAGGALEFGLITPILMLILIVSLVNVIPTIFK